MKHDYTKIDLKLELDLGEIKTLVQDKVVDALFDRLMEGPADLDWEQKQVYREKELTKILNKIDWKNAAPALTEAVVKKFFEGNMK